MPQSGEEGKTVFMILGMPIITFIALAVQPVIIILAILYAINYDKLIKKPPFNFYQRLEDQFKDDETKD